MDAAQWPPQQIGGGMGRTMEEIPKVVMGHNKKKKNNNNNNSNEGMMNYCPSAEGMVERRGRGQKEQNLNCPRCHSTNTKFCYYNNYSLSQPRYFCKTCRRYWTQGGSLRNVPVGGGSRKNKRSSSILASSSPSSSSVLPASPSNKLIPDLNPNPNPPSSFISPSHSHQNPNNFLQGGGGQDLNLAFPIQGIFHPNLDQHHQLPKFEAPNDNHDDPHPLTVNVNLNVNGNNNNNNNIASTSTSSSCATSACSSSPPMSALELLRTGIATRGSLNTFVPMSMPDSNTLYPSSGFPTLHHPIHNHNHNHNHMATLFPPPHDNPHQQHGSDDHHNIGAGAARLFFPFADMNKIATSTTTPSDHHHHHHPISDQTKAVNDHHPHHQASTGYWTGLLGGGSW